MYTLLDKAVFILSFLKPKSKNEIYELGASEISLMSSIPVGTVHRILMNLKKHGLVEQNMSNKKFRLGYLFVEYGFLVWSQSIIKEYAKPILTKLVERTEETAFLFIKNNNEGILIDKVESPKPIRMVEDIGVRRPLNKGASRKCLLAYTEDDEQKKIINSLYATSEKKAMKKLIDELKKIKRNGYAFTAQEISSESFGIAAPVFNGFSDYAIAVITIGGPLARLSEQKLSELKKETINASKKLSNLLSRK